MIETVRDLITALLQMPMDSYVEVRHPDLVRAVSVASVEEMPNVAYGKQYVNVELVG